MCLGLPHLAAAARPRPQISTWGVSFDGSAASVSVAVRDVDHGSAMMTMQQGTSEGSNISLQGLRGSSIYFTASGVSTNTTATIADCAIDGSFSLTTSGWGPGARIAVSSITANVIYATFSADSWAGIVNNASSFALSDLNVLLFFMLGLYTSADVTFVAGPNIRARDLMVTMDGVGTSDVALLGFEAEKFSLTSSRFTRSRLLIDGFLVAGVAMFDLAMYSVLLGAKLLIRNVAAGAVTFGQNGPHRRGLCCRHRHRDMPPV